MDPATDFDRNRVVRLERWDPPRAFYVVPCAFRVDLPLDMGGCIAAALHDTMRARHRRIPGGLLMASDRGANGRSLGAIFVEVEPGSDDPSVAWLEGDLLVRSLPPRAIPLRAEVDELVRWSGELGHDVSSFFVSFVPGEGPRSFRPVRLIAALEDRVVETFEIRSKRSYVMRASL